MFSLQDLLGQQQGSEAVEQISQNVGAEPSAVNTAIQAALPMILGGLANNASSPQGAESLNSALEQDHDGSVLDNLGGLGGMIFGGGQETAPSRQADAGGILGHILGGNQGAVAQEVSKQSGLGSGQVAQILMMLAPIVMGYLGRQKQEQGVGPGGIGDLLGGLLGGQQAGHSTGAAAGGFLDRDGDGSSMDDIASMAFDYLRKR
ncbi:MAG TPA: DUF937 domain-containing protein [Pyrinomonadaceae bacterium]|nr:DUF937 domain-containing protein [Pyrinomonadaceae bacterium]